MYIKMNSERHHHQVPFWAVDPAVLVHRNQWTEVWPKSMVLSNANLNALFCLALCIGVFGRIIGLSMSILWVPIVVGLFTFLAFWWKSTPRSVFHSLDDDTLKESFPTSTDTAQFKTYSTRPSSFLRENTTGSTTEPRTHPTTLQEGHCRTPSASNPFGNVLIPEMQQQHTHRHCSRKDIPNPTEQQNTAFQTTQNPSFEQVFKDESTRQFFTMPWTSVPNDEHGDFGNWLYDTPPVVKGSSLW